MLSSSTSLKYSCICSLWISKVNQFIHQLIADNKVIPDALLLHLLEVLLHHLADPVQQCEEHGNVGVLPGGGHYVQVTVLDVSKGTLVCFNEGTAVVIILQFRHQPYELVNHCVLDVSPVVPVHQHLPLHVQEVDGTTGHDDSETLLRSESS